ncbi:MAG: hypothetical protein IPL00_14405 [Gammaproteobacteria bacterium]|nr:hypothetical protein [Gammaproteobacteria bacterium]
MTIALLISARHASLVLAHLRLSFLLHVPHSNASAGLLGRVASLIGPTHQIVLNLQNIAARRVSGFRGTTRAGFMARLDVAVELGAIVLVTRPAVGELAITSTTPSTIWAHALESSMELHIIARYDLYGID